MIAARFFKALQLFASLALIMAKANAQPPLTPVDTLDGYWVAIFSSPIKNNLPQIKNKLLKLNLQFKATGTQFVVFKAPQIAEQTSLTRNLASLPNFLLLRRDQLMRAKQTPSHSTPNSNEIKNTAKCQLGFHCADGSNPAWAKLSVGADLANILLEKMLHDSGSAKQNAASIAVVDSGFDFNNQNAHVDALSFSTHKGHESSGNENEDFDGHGTAVVSMIAGKGIGLTNQVHLKSYRATEVFAGGSVSSAMLASTIEKACAESDIVNVSWGSFLDDSQGIDIKSQLWYKEALKRGCLVVKAAGNDGLRNPRIYQPSLGDPLIVAAASNSFGNMASFSTLGQVIAPGEGTYTLLSNAAPYSSNTLKKYCHGANSPIGPVNGTSFAAPASAGVMGMIIGALRAKGLLSKPLPGQPRMLADDIKLIKNIFFAASLSKNSGVVDSLVAIKIIDHMTIIKPSYRDDKGAHEIYRDFKEKQTTTCVRQKFPTNCLSINICNDKIKCVNEARSHMHLCAESSEEYLEPFSQYLKSIEENELLASITRQLFQNPMTEALAQKQFTQHWRANVDPNNIRTVKSGDLALDLLASAIDSKKPLIHSDNLYQALQSWDINNAFSLSEPFSTDPRQSGSEASLLKFLSVFLALSTDEQLKFVHNLDVSKAIHQTSIVGALYFLDLNRQKLSEDIKLALDEKIELFLNDWITGNLQINKLFSKSNRPLFEQFFSNREKFRLKLQNMVSSPSPSDFNEELIQFALTSKQILSDSEIQSYVKRFFLASPENRNSSKAQKRFLETIRHRSNVVENSESNLAIVQDIMSSTSELFPAGLVPKTVEQAQSSGLGTWGKDRNFWISLASRLFNVASKNMLSSIDGTVSKENYHTQILNFCSVLWTLPDHMLNSEGKKLFLNDRKESIKTLIQQSTDLILSEPEDKKRNGMNVLDRWQSTQCSIVLKYNPELEAFLNDQLLRLLPIAKDKGSKISDDTRLRILKLANESEADTLPNLHEHLKVVESKKLNTAMFSITYEDHARTPTSEEKAQWPRAQTDSGNLQDLWSKNLTYALAGESQKVIYSEKALSILEAAQDKKLGEFISDEKLIMLLAHDTHRNALKKEISYQTPMPEYARKELETQGRLVELFSKLPISQQLRMLNYLSNQNDPDDRLLLAALVHLLRTTGVNANSDFQKTLDTYAYRAAGDWVNGKIPIRSLYEISKNKGLIKFWLSTLKSLGGNAKAAALNEKNSLTSEGWFYFTISSTELTPDEKQSHLWALMKNSQFKLNDPAGVNLVLNAYHSLRLGEKDNEQSVLKQFLVRNSINSNSFKSLALRPGLLPENSEKVTQEQSDIARDSKFIMDMTASLMDRYNDLMTDKEIPFLVGSDVYFRHYFEWVNNPLISQQARKQILARDDEVWNNLIKRADFLVKNSNNSLVRARAKTLLEVYKEQPSLE